MNNVLSMSKIEWTKKTWNPVVGCSKVSAGCKNCYAIRMAWRLQHIGHSKDKYAGTVEKSPNGQLNWTGKVNIIEKELLKPLSWKKSVIVFVNSESDLFHESVSFEFIDKVFAVMALCPQHTFQVLTKRPAQMAEYFKRRDGDMREIREAAMILVCDYPHLFHVTERLKGEARKQIGHLHITSTILPLLKEAGWYWDVTNTEFGNESKLEFDGEWPLKNVWLGVSVENQQAANDRIPLLARTPAAFRFISCEPLLGPIKITFASGSMNLKCIMCSGTGTIHISNQSCIRCNGTGQNPAAIHWVICGGESGKEARPMHPDWARSLRNQCKQIGAAFFFKQWGQWKPREDGDSLPSIYGTFKNKPGDWNDSPVGTFIPYIIGLNWGTVMMNVGKNAAGRLLDGREWNEFPGKPLVPTDDPDLFFTGGDY